MAWDSKLVISGLEMLIWQAIKQVELFSTSLSVSVAIDEDELYSVMKAAVSSK
jgi:shikimate 5-dehydrogenase